MGDRIAAALDGRSKSSILGQSIESLVQPRVIGLSTGKYASKPQNKIQGTGYAVASLEAALWCFARTESFEEAVLTAVNLGDDADTTGAIVGQLAGAFYGRRSIPERWLQRLHMSDRITEMATALYSQSGANASRAS